MPTFAVSTQVGSRFDELVVLVLGEVDLSTAPILEAELIKTLEAGPRTIVVDLGDVAFLDSAGCHALLKASRRGQDEGIPVVLARVPDRCRRVFEITGILDLFTTRGDSLATVQPHRG